MLISYIKFNCKLFSLVVLSSLCLIVLCFSQGLSGDFLFDDFPNLASLSLVDDFNSSLRFVISGQSGPTGRPISLLSFVLQANSWPESPSVFIAMNIVIHVINSVLIGCVTYCLLRPSLGSSRSISLSFAISLLWAVLPNHVSTVNYVIQRMTLLSATFYLLGFYSLLLLLGCERLSLFRRVFTASLTLICLLLAGLSKENAFTFPFVAVFCIFLYPKKLKDDFVVKIMLFVYLVLSIAILVYLSRYVLHEDRYYGPRGFTLLERLLTQADAIRQYISNFIFPRPYTGALFNDNIVVPSSLWAVIVATSIGFAFVSTVVCCSYRVIVKQCLVCFFLLFFFLNHILESTVVSIEMYFEHRNYLPYVGLSGSLIYGAYLFWKRSIRSVKPIIVCSLSLLLIFNVIALYFRASLWGNPMQAAIYWVDINPDSARANRHAAAYFSRARRLDLSIKYLRNAYAIDQSPFTLLNALNAACRSEYIIEGLELPLEDFHSGKFVKDGYLVLLDMIKAQRDSECSQFTRQDALNVVNAVLDNPHYRRSSQAPVYRFLKGVVFLNMGDHDDAFRVFIDMQRRGAVLDLTEAAINEFTSRGGCEEARTLLDNVLESTRDVYNGGVKMALVGEALLSRIEQGVGSSCAISD